MEIVGILHLEQSLQVAFVLADFSFREQSVAAVAGEGVSHGAIAYAEHCLHVMSLGGRCRRFNRLRLNTLRYSAALHAERGVFIGAHNAFFVFLYLGRKHGN